MSGMLSQQGGPRVRVGRVHNHLHSATPLSDEQVQAFNTLLCEADLQALADQTGPDEWLLIRKLDVQARWQPSSPVVDASRVWAQALEQAAATAVHAPQNPDVLRYRDLREGLTDLIYRSALGEAARQWAWQRMGWIDRTGLPTREVLAQGLRHLRQQPGWIWPVLAHHLAAEPSTGAFTALLRAVPAHAWFDLLAQVGTARAYVTCARGAVLDGAVPGGRMSGHGLPGEHGHARAGDSDAVVSVGVALSASTLPPLAQALHQWAKQRPHLAQAHADVLAALLASLAWPDQGSGPQVVRARWAQARAWIDGGGSAQAAWALRRGAGEHGHGPEGSDPFGGQAQGQGFAPEPGLGNGPETEGWGALPPSRTLPDGSPTHPPTHLAGGQGAQASAHASAQTGERGARGEGAGASAGQASARAHAHAPGWRAPDPNATQATPAHTRAHTPTPGVDDRDALPEAPALPDASQWQPTAWGGALFWLNALKPDAVRAELLGPTQGAESPASADPMGHALCAVGLALGVPPGDAALQALVGGHWPQGEPQPGVAQAAHALVARWQAWLDEAAPDLPQPRLQAVCQRAGRLRFEPGWIELHLPLDAVATPIRRLGLDADPGHLPWLGCVVKVCYG